MIVKRFLFGAALILTAIGQTNRNEAGDTELPATRGFGRAVVIKNDIYYFGGGNSAIDILDPQSGEWSRASLGMSSPQLIAPRPASPKNQAIKGTLRPDRN